MQYIGVDACKYGWFAVSLDEEGWQIKTFSNIFSLWNCYKDAALVLVDVPIGLRERDNNERLCDKEARKLLGYKRGSSVFPVPCRAAVYAKSYEEASKINQNNTGRKLSKQSWGIIPKIKEVDQLLSSNMAARAKIREIHPEVCFWAFTGYKPMTYSKKKGLGFEKRLEVLSSIYPKTQDVVDSALSTYLRREVAKDDILDALVAAVTASMAKRGLLTIPVTLETDMVGLPMEMVYNDFHPRASSKPVITSG